MVDAMSPELTKLAKEVAMLPGFEWRPGMRQLTGSPMSVGFISGERSQRQGPGVARLAEFGHDLSREGNSGWFPDLLDDATIGACLGLLREGSWVEIRIIREDSMSVEIHFDDDSDEGHRIEAEGSTWNEARGLVLALALKAYLGAR